MPEQEPPNQESEKIVVKKKSKGHGRKGVVVTIVRQPGEEAGIITEVQPHPKSKPNPSETEKK